MATEVTIGPEGQERGTGARTGVWNRGGPGGQVGGGGGGGTALFSPENILRRVCRTTSYVRTG